MAASDRSLRQQRVAGAVVLTAILGTGWAATGILDLFEPAQASYVATTTTDSGAAGLEAGGPVLYGGAERGRITAIETPSSDDAAVGEIRIAFVLDQSLPLAKDASIVRSVGVAGSGGALSILAPGDPALAFAGDDPRVIPLNAGSVAPADGAEILLGRRNAEMLRSIEVSLRDLGEELSPRMADAARIARSIGMLLDQLTLDVASDDLQASTEQRLVAIIRQLQDGLPELQANLIASREAMQELELEINREGGRIRRGVGVVDRNLEIMKLATEEITVAIEATLVPKLLQIRRASLAAVLDSERLLAEGVAIRSEISTSIPQTLANMKLAGGQLALAFDDLLGLALKAIMISPDVDSEMRRRLLEAVDSSVRAAMDVRLAADRVRTLVGHDPAVLENGPEALRAHVESFQTAVDRLETITQGLARTLAEAVAADGDARPTPVP